MNGFCSSLGLIVTELVINALKHAFPAKPVGMITVGYSSTGSDWTLSVTDNDIGMPTGSEALKAGLGTGLVKALARNVQGEIQLSNADPGTAMTITRPGGRRAPSRPSTSRVGTIMPPKLSYLGSQSSSAHITWATDE